MTVVVNGYAFVGTPEECWELVRLANGYNTIYTPTCNWPLGSQPECGEQLQDGGQIKSSRFSVDTKSWTAYYEGEKIEEMSEKRLREIAGILHLDRAYDIDTMDKGELMVLLTNAATLNGYDEIS